MIAPALAALLAASAPASAATAAAPTAADAAASPARAPSEIAAAAPAGDWRAIPTGDLLVMDLAPTATGKPRRVVIQLIPAPFSQSWVRNIRMLATQHWWDGAGVNRVQDNYVAQWGGSTAKRPLPASLTATEQADYTTHLAPADLGPIVAAPGHDAYAPETFTWRGWPIAAERGAGGTIAWPVHCYGMVGVGRDMPPDAGDGSELYAVIGHAPRHLDRNIALVGRVIEGIELLSSLPRGTEALGVYATPAEHVPIASVRLASDLPVAERPRFEYLATESTSFARYADARANRRDGFFVRPAGGADICNVPTPIRRIAAR
ncbi:peptidylprolyl isomerase [Sphingomonas lycopersici]|uniref:Peptidylprolyl isomerase n=1 Tax=Sphingomonas lycopersici TaxID=2951807 RepID=A0AA41ZBE6_9SPHN|nr:peptidylprolyl isomerase [Sphingomonas lycopersici]MCW6536519.1 peptidylprolyl isomerase [Sphingomonas lycopersici]